MVRLTGYKNIGLMGLAFGIALIAGEMYLRWNPPIAVYFDTCNNVQQTHSELSPYPYVWYVPRANLTRPFNNREFKTLIEINSKNMRDREYPIAKPAGVRRITAMGDSFIFGWGVSIEESVTEILETEYLKNTEVLNFGVSGYTAYQQLERLKREALKFNPDQVLFFLYGFPEGYPESPENPYKIEGGLLRPSFLPPLTVRKKILHFIERNIYLAALIQEVRGRFQRDEDSGAAAVTDHSQDSRKGLEILNEFKKMGEAHRFNPLVVYIPDKHSLMGGDKSEQDNIAEFCSRENIPFLDLTDSLNDFWRQKKIFPFYHYDNHWNKHGHRVAAETLAKLIEHAEFPDA